jgi:cobalamin synthase
LALDVVKRRTTGVLGLTVLLSLAILALGLASGDDRTQIFYAMVGLPVLVLALVGLVRIRTADTDAKAGTVSIQHHWMTLSVALAFLALVPGTFFRAPDSIKIAAGALAAILILIPLWSLFDTRKATGVTLSI